MRYNTIKKEKSQFLPLSHHALAKIAHCIPAKMPRGSHLISSFYIWNAENKFKYKKLSQNTYMIHLKGWIDARTNIMTTTHIKSLEDISHISKECLGSETKRLHEVSIEPELLDAVKEKFNVQEERNSAEYLYLVDKLSKMEGREFADHRHKINKHKSLYEHISFKAMKNPPDKKAVEEISALYELWHDFGTDGSLLKDSYETVALNRYLNMHNSHENYLFKEMKHYYLRINNKLAGFAVVELIKPDYAVGHFLKINLNITGATEYFIQKIAKNLQKEGIAYLNSQEDRGIEGLRQYKEHLKPFGFNKAYTLTIL